MVSFYRRFCFVYKKKNFAKSWTLQRPNSMWTVEFIGLCSLVKLYGPSVCFRSLKFIALASTFSLFQMSSVLLPVIFRFAWFIYTNRMKYTEFFFCFNCKLSNSPTSIRAFSPSTFDAEGLRFNFRVSNRNCQLVARFTWLSWNIENFDATIVLWCNY